MATTRATDGSALWQIMSGSSYCQIVDGGRCVTDGSGSYGNNERCEVKALQPLAVTAEQYNVEECCDYVTINGNEFKGTGPQAVVMNAGATWIWTSDRSKTHAGFKLCAQAVGMDVDEACVCTFVRMYAWIFVSLTFLRLHREQRSKQCDRLLV